MMLHACAFSKFAGYKKLFPFWGEETLNWVLKAFHFFKRAKVGSIGCWLGLFTKQDKRCFQINQEKSIYLVYIHSSQLFLDKFIPVIFLINPNYANLNTNFPDVSSQNGRKQRFLPTLGVWYNCSLSLFIMTAENCDRFFSDETI